MLWKVRWDRTVNWRRCFSVCVRGSQLLQESRSFKVRWHDRFCCVISLLRRENIIGCLNEERTRWAFGRTLRNRAGCLSFQWRGKAVWEGRSVLISSQLGLLEVRRPPLHHKAAKVGRNHSAVRESDQELLEEGHVEVKCQSPNAQMRSLPACFWWHRRRQETIRLV